MRNRLVQARKACGNAFALLCLLALGLAGQPATAHDYYISPTGTASGAGTITSPWDIATGLQKSSLVKPGDTVWLRGGTYGGGGSLVYSCSLQGSSLAPVIVRQYSGEQAKVDAALKVSGSYVWLWGFEITNSSPQREVSNIDSERPRGIVIGTAAIGVKIINMVIHDAGRAGVGGGTNGYEIYGTLFWGNGIYDLSSGGAAGSGTEFPRGNAVYLNLWNSTPEPAAVNYLRDNIAFRNFFGGFKVYTEWPTTYIDGYHLEGNIAFDNAARSGSYPHKEGNLLVNARLIAPPTKGLQVISNFTFRTADSSNPYNAEFGCALDSGIQCQDVEIRNNYFVAGATHLGAFEAMNWQTLQVTDNTAVGGSGTVTQWIRQFTPSSFVWDRNRYRNSSDTPFKLTTTATQSYSLSDWQNSIHADASSTFVGGRPTGVEAVVRPNLYEPGERAHVIVYNWDLQSAISVDLTPAAFADGTSFEVIDAQNYFGPPVAAGVFYATSPVIVLPMNLTAVAPLVGNVTHLTNDHTAPEFAAFIVRRTAGTKPGVDLRRERPRPRQLRQIISSRTRSADMIVSSR